MSVQIVGSYVDHEYGYGGYTGKTTNVEEVVATFDCEKEARLYVENSRLKNPRDNKRPFRAKSLLSEYEYASVEGFKDPPPHNPQLGKRRK